MRYPLKKVFITQEWGVNGHIYKRFGYKGHNGIDLRLHQGNGTPIFSPHNGTVKERRFDKDGYGNYLKIESDKEGSILAHLQKFNVNINKHIKEGELIGWGDNTGWSTGPHLHWGYYRFPRNRNNGYGGTINQKPFINMNDDEITIKKDLFEKLVAEGSIGKEFLKYWKTPEEAIQLISSWRTAYDNEKREKETAKEAMEKYKKKYNDFVKTLADDDHLRTRIDPVEIEAKAKLFGTIEADLEDTTTAYSKDKEGWAISESELLGEIARLKALLEQKDVLENVKLKELIKELIRRFKKMLPSR